METLTLYALTLTSVRIALCLQLLDVATTIIVLRGRGGYESNPIVSGLMDVAGPLWPLLKVIITMAGTIAFALSPWPWMVWALNALMVWVIWHNVGVIRRQRAR